MNKIFPPEIIQFSTQNHFVKHHSSSKKIYLVVIVFLFLVFISLPFITVDISIPARGVLRSPLENNKIQAVVYGEILQIKMDENKRITKGDTLLTLRTDKIDEQLRAAHLRKNEAEQNIEDLNQLLADRTPRGYKYLGEYFEVKSKIKEQSTQLAYLEKEFKRSEVLYRSKVAPEYDYFQAKNRYDMALKQREISMSQYQNRWRIDKNRLSLEALSITSEIAQLEKEKRNYVLLAPSSGHILKSEGIQSGSFITPGQVLGFISQDQLLVAECYLSPSDIGFIYPNQKVAFQFDAFNYREWGTVEGVVKQISNDLVMVDDKQSAFKVRCQLKTTHLKLKNGFRGNVRKGMTITGQFYLTKRTLAQLLFDKMDNWMNPKQFSSSN